MPRGPAAGVADTLAVAVAVARILGAAVAGTLGAAPTLGAVHALAEHRACLHLERVHHLERVDHIDRLSLPDQPYGRLPPLFVVAID
jgi:hypothetical protein